MARGRKPSGLPSKRIVGFLRPEETGIDARVADQPERLRRVRRVAVLANVVVAALVVVLAVTGNGDAAFGLAAILLAPFLLLLAGAQAAVMVSGPKKEATPSDDS